MARFTRNQIIVNGVAISLLSIAAVYIGTLVVRMERFMIGERCTLLHCETMREHQTRVERRLHNLEDRFEDLPPDTFESVVYDLRDRVSRLENRVLGKP